MAAQFTSLPVMTTKIFDGLEDNLFNNEFEILVPNTGKILVSPDDIVKNNFNDLDQVIMELVATEKHLEFQNGLFPGYVGTDDLDLYYLTTRSLLLLFSLGEYQPARYKFYFEGAWLTS